VGQEVPEGDRLACLGIGERQIGNVLNDRAVKTLEIEPIWKSVSRVTGWPVSMLVAPKT
jgi:hypothetical protein